MAGIQVYKPIHVSGTQATSSLRFFLYAFLLFAIEVNVTLGTITRFHSSNYRIDMKVEGLDCM